MRRDLSEIQNYLEFLYNNIDDETQKVEISVDVFEDLREYFNASILSLVQTSEAQLKTNQTLLISLAINLVLAIIFIFKV